jgi:hypothetical protein
MRLYLRSPIKFELVATALGHIVTTKRLSESVLDKRIDSEFVSFTERGLL